MFNASHGWIAGGMPDRIGRPRLRRTDGTKLYRIARSSVPMRGSVLLFIPTYDPEE